MSRSSGAGERGRARITDRQGAVLRAVVASYVGAAAPVGSKLIAHLLPVALSSASVRNTLAELTELGLVEKPHRSSGRVPTEAGLRVFVDELLAPSELPRDERREIDFHFREAAPDAVADAASQLLSQRTRQLGFALAPRVDRAVLRHVSLVRASSERLMVVLVTDMGIARRVIDADPDLDQAQLDRMAVLLCDRAVGRTLAEVRTRLEREARALGRQANAWLSRTVALGCRALASDEHDAGDLVIGTRIMLLEQPEFAEPRRLRDLFEALETKTRLIEVLDEVLAPEGVSVAFGAELSEPGLRHCAVVASAYGGGAGREPLGVLGVIGPSRMDFARVIPLVEYLSERVGDRLHA